MNKKAVVFSVFILGLASATFAQYCPPHDFTKTDANAEVQAAKVEQAKKDFDYQSIIKRHELNIAQPSFFGRGAARGSLTVEASYDIDTINDIARGDIAITLLALKPYIKILEAKLGNMPAGNSAGRVFNANHINKLKIAAKELENYYDSASFIKTDKVIAIKAYSLAKIIRLALPKGDTQLLLKTIERLTKI